MAVEICVKNPKKCHENRSRVMIFIGMIAFPSISDNNLLYRIVCTMRLVVYKNISPGLQGAPSTVCISCS